MNDTAVTHHPKRSGTVAIPVYVLVLWLLCGCTAGFGADRGEPPVFLDMGMTAEALGDVNFNDATAAFKTYATMFGAERGLVMEVDAEVFDGLGDLRQALEEGRMRVVGLQTQEYLELRGQVPLDLMFKAERSGTSLESYVVLVRADSDLHQIADLRNADFKMMSGTNMGLAPIWVDVLLMESGLPAGADYFRTIALERTAPLTVLPVFFGRTDACLVSSHAFETMVELNPQVGQRLRVLCQSPDVVPFVTCIRSDFTGQHRRQTEESFLTAHQHPSGQQAHLLFRHDRMLPCTEADLKTARDLVDRYRRLSMGRPGSGE
jgi:phosphonate transport system substrate-binding protein